MSEFNRREHNIAGMLEMFDVDVGFSAFLRGEVLFQRQWSGLLFELDFRGDGPRAVSAACASIGFSAAVCMNVDANAHETFDIGLDIADLEGVHIGFTCLPTP